MLSNLRAFEYYLVKLKYDFHLDLTQLMRSIELLNEGRCKGNYQQYSKLEVMESEPHRPAIQSRDYQGYLQVLTEGNFVEDLSLLSFFDFQHKKVYQGEIKADDHLNRNLEQWSTKIHPFENRTPWKSKPGWHGRTTIVNRKDLQRRNKSFELMTKAVSIFHGCYPPTPP